METKRRIYKKCGNIVVSAIFVAAILTFALAPIASAAGAGNALDFDGTDDYVDIPADGSLNNNNFTVEFWAKLAKTQSWNTLLDKGAFHDPSDWYFVCIDGSYAIRFGCGSGNEFDYNFGDSNWHHIVAAYDGTNIYGYLDGKLIYSGARTYTSSTNAIRMGRRLDEVGSVGTYPFEGQLDEVRIWNYARTATQIRENMCKELAGNENGLVAYYRFDQSSGTTLPDLTSNDNDGTLKNMDDGDWVTSTAAIGDKSHYGTGTSNLAENSDVPVDITWDGDTPGANAIFDAIQNDDAPDVTMGLLTNYPSTYWEIWIANNDSFKADVKFHYDDIGGIGNENALSLYTRSAAGESWIEVTDITRDVEGSNTDGVGLIAANNLTGFSQFIITSDDPVNPVPELPTVVLFSIGLLMLVGYVARKRF